VIKKIIFMNKIENIFLVLLLIAGNSACTAKFRQAHLSSASETDQLKTESPNPTNNTATDAVTMQVNVPNGGGVFSIYLNGGIKDLDFGDGTVIPSLTDTDYIDNPAIEHTYAAGTYTVTFKDDLVQDLRVGPGIQEISGLENLNTAREIDLSGNELTSFNSNLPTSLYKLNIGSNQLTSFAADLPNAFQELGLRGNELTSFDIELPSSLLSLDLRVNELTSFTSELPESLSFLGLSSNQLSESTINSVLADLIAKGISSGEFHLSNQVPAAPPSGQGAANKLLLQAAGISLDTDVPADVVALQVTVPDGGATFKLYLDGGIKEIDFGDGTTQADASDTYLFFGPAVSHWYDAGTYTLTFKDDALVGFRANTHLTGISGLENLSSLEALYLSGSPITEFSATLPSTLKTFEFNQSNLIGFTSVLPSSLEVLNLQFNELTSASINSVLANLVLLGRTSGTYALSFQDPVAAPTDQGVADKATLQGAGLTVLTD
jgi:Leucine-rich repeat (LRR) protein